MINTWKIPVLLSTSAFFVVKNVWVVAQNSRSIFRSQSVYFTYQGSEKQKKNLSHTL